MVKSLLPFFKAISDKGNVNLDIEDDEYEEIIK